MCRVFPPGLIVLTNSLVIEFCKKAERACYLVVEVPGSVLVTHKMNLFYDTINFLLEIIFAPYNTAQLILF